MFLQFFAVFYTGNIVSSVSFCFQDENYACATRQGSLTKIRACEHFQKFLRARASEHSSNFCEQFGQRPNFASTFELDSDHSTRLLHNLCFLIFNLENIYYFPSCSGGPISLLHSFTRSLPVRGVAPI